MPYKTINDYLVEALTKKDEEGKTGLENIYDVLNEMETGYLNGEKISEYKKKEAIRLKKKYEEKFPKLRNEPIYKTEPIKIKLIK